jgi:hypothetical protein
MSILATTTSGWEVNSYLNKTGLFQTCYKDSCTDISNKHDIPIGFAIVGQCLIAFGVIGSFANTFIYRRRIGSIIITILFFLACLFFWMTILTISSYLYLNGGSAIVFHAAIAFTLLAAFTASYALGTSFAVTTPVQTTLPLEFYQHSDVFKTRVKK